MELAYNDLVFKIPVSVYEPAEDSFMLAKGAAELKGKILEIGCGSGIVSLSNARQNPGNHVLGVDINPDAVECAKQNAKSNNLKNCEFVKSDLFSNVGQNADTITKFDAILFNPPYLPTGENERINDELNHAFDGGEDGRKVLDRFLVEFDNYLKQGGILLLVQSSLNDLEKTKSVLGNLGYKVEIQDQQDFFFEKLYLIKGQKP
ncbi:MAG: HemK2/MTQ2 family protein methyltransferase [Candidatus Micrarchaeota archaeon]|nr:methyltransferase [Candidatus Micrarchaeota archaeon]MBU1886487.1 methyltransferase [Candidatus Micrarchaeota archaeon]